MGQFCMPRSRIRPKTDTMHPVLEMDQFFILRSRVQQEYNSLLVNALNRIFKSNLSLNNFKWLLTKLELSCVQNIIPRSKSGASKSRPRWAAHTRIGNVWEYPPPPPPPLRDSNLELTQTKVDFSWISVIHLL